MYKARCKNGGGLCAFKLAHPKKVCVHLLEAEAAILRTLNHPNIAKVHGCGEGPLGSYIAMELCSGGDLFDFLGRKGPLSEQAAAGVMRQLLAAVAHMHSVGVCHGDLKEENLLLCSPGTAEELQVKVCDFGIARRVRGSHSPWAAGLCTPSHAAPEVLRGEMGAETGDLWSCGVVLYALLCGRRPFEGKSRDEVLASVCSGGPSFHEAAWSEVSEGAVMLVRSFLQMKREERCTAEQALAHAWLARQQPSSPDAKVSECFPVKQTQCQPAVRPSSRFNAVKLSSSWASLSYSGTARTMPLPQSYQRGLPAPTALVSI